MFLWFAKNGIILSEDVKPYVTYIFWPEAFVWFQDL